MARARAFVDPVKSEAPLEEGQSRPTVVDLVARAGGLSHGFASLGVRILLALDQDREAMKTYRLNHPELPDERIVVDDIKNVEISFLRKLVGRKRLDVLVGSPPCPGYSAAGFRSRKSRTGCRPRRSGAFRLSSLQAQSSLAARWNCWMVNRRSLYRMNTVTPPSPLPSARFFAASRSLRSPIVEAANPRYASVFPRRQLGTREGPRFRGPRSRALRFPQLEQDEGELEWPPSRLARVEYPALAFMVVQRLSQLLALHQPE